MLGNLLKEKLARGEMVYGCFVNLPCPDLVEISGLMGFDFALIDCEHGPIDYATATHMIRAADAAGIPCLVRTPQNVAQVILRYLDAGAVGVQVPQIHGVAEVEAAVRAVKYHPRGARGLAATRAARYGIPRPLPEYVTRANDETMVVVQVETLEAVRNLPAFLEVPGVDVYFVGPSDLSQSMGVPGEVSHPDVQAAVARCVEQIRAAGRVAGTIAIDVEHGKRMRDLGVQYLVPGAARLFISAIRQFMEAMR
ncbi:MAG: aldolase/citrate lyase family protein [Armatimonadota bacterium]|nr:aldolase/citrate lyase family protein [Armatimonadota bacterium]